MSFVPFFNFLDPVQNLDLLVVDCSHLELVVLVRIGDGVVLLGITHHMFFIKWDFVVIEYLLYIT